MIDGIKIYCDLQDFEKWKAATNISFDFAVMDTGVVKEKVRNNAGLTIRTITHRAMFKTYYLTVKEIRKTNTRNTTTTHYNLLIEGSLHKNHFAGKNYQSFTWTHLQAEIFHLQQSLQLDPEELILQNVEIGVNIETQTPVFNFLDASLICFKGLQFNKYNPDKNGKCLGFYCKLSQYSVKIYDKGLQNDLPYNLMRFELRFIKMQKLKSLGIETLHDLTDLEKVNNLMHLLLTAWELVLLFDSTININKLPLNKKDKSILKYGSNPNYWKNLKTLNIRKYNYHRDRFKKLTAKYGNNSHELILQIIKREWKNLFKNCTNLPSGKNEKLYKFTHTVNGKNVQKSKSTLLTSANI